MAEKTDPSRYYKNDINMIGTNSMKHTALAYALLLPLAFIWIWELLGIVGITYSITRSWVALLLGCIWVAVGIIALVAGKFLYDMWMREADEEGNPKMYVHQRSAIINDWEFLKRFTALGVCYLVVTLTVYCAYYQKLGDSTYQKGFHLDNSTLFMSKGLETMVAVKISHALGFLLTFIGVYTFFTGYSNASLASYIDQDGASPKKTAAYFAASSSQTPLQTWASKKTAVDSKSASRV